MNYTVTVAPFTAPHSQHELQLQAQYDSLLPKLDEYLALEKIHRQNLAYLQMVSAKYSLDTPLKIANEMRDEQEQLDIARSEIGRLEHALTDQTSLKKIDQAKISAVEEELQTKKEQLEIHEKNIAYLNTLAERHGAEVPLSLHNTIAEEAQRFLFARRSIAKLSNVLSYILEVKSFGMGKPSGAHDAKIYAMRNAASSTVLDERILEMIGKSAYENDILCVVKADKQIYFVTDRQPTPEEVFFLASVAHESGRIPDLYCFPNDQLMFYARYGWQLVHSELDCYCRSRSMELKDIDFLPSNDFAYLETYHNIYYGNSGYEPAWWKRWLEKRNQKKRTKKLGLNPERYQREVKDTLRGMKNEDLALDALARATTEAILKRAEKS